MSKDLLAVSAVLDALSGYCQSERAALFAARLQPFGDVASARSWHDRTDEGLFLIDSGLAPAVANQLDHSRALDLATRSGVLEGKQLRALGIALFSAETLRLAADLWPDRAVLLRDAAHRLPRLSLLANLLCDAIDERGELLDDASPELARLRAEVRRRAGGLRRRIAAMVKETDAEGLLQDDYYTVRDGRFVLPVKASDKRVLDGIIHGSSHTGQTVYLEPTEMVEANNGLSLAAEAVKREERRILAEFSASVARHADEIEQTCELLAQIDLHMATARFAAAMRASRPVLGTLEEGISLRGLEHPKLLLAGADVVGNDVELTGAARWLIVSGPNGGGKTVLLTAVGLAAEMARRGLFICARPGSRLPFVASVSTVLGDAQDLDAGHSTFSGHLALLAGALQDAQTGPALVLLDELAAGTEPLAGSALARAVLEAFAERPCIGLVATHFEALKLLPLSDPRCANAALELDPETLRPTFRLRFGIAGSSSPLALAERMGLPATIVDRARALTGSGSRDTERTLKRLQELKQQAEIARADALSEQKMAKYARQRLEEQRRFEKRTADQRIEVAARDALAEIESARDAARAARKQIRRGVGLGGSSGASLGSGASAGEGAVEVLVQHEKKVKARLNAARRNLPDAKSLEPLDASALTPGMLVHHGGLGVDVEILDVSKGGKKVRVKVGLMQMNATADQLFKAKKGRPPPRKKSPPSPAPPPVPDTAFDDEDHTADFRTGDWTCDLRGKRVDEALTELDLHLDRAVVAGVRGVCIVHGHGTGALRKAVTEHLRTHQQIARSRLGERDEGGAGATMVWMER